MKASWRELEDLIEPDAWRGLVGTVVGCGSPGMCVSTSGPARMAITVGGQSVVKAEVEPDSYGYELVRGTGQVSPNVVDYIPFSVVNDESHRWASPRSYGRFWARFFAKQLLTGSRSPLHDGMWHLGPIGRGFRQEVLTTSWVEEVVRQSESGYVEWSGHVYPVTLRDASPPDNGRVKAWRKHARGGGLPPVLMWWVSGLQAYVVLDGHDRLHACALEGVDAPVIGLHRVEVGAPDQADRDEILGVMWDADRSDVDGLNRVVLRMYQETMELRGTRAVYLPDEPHSKAKEPSA